jgi:capsular exopolysaccharide synthesis family protein
MQLESGSSVAAGVTPAPGEGLSPARTRPALEHQRRRLEYELSLLTKDVEAQRERVSSAGDVAQRLAQYDEDLRRLREFSELVRSRILVLDTESKAPLHIRTAQANEPSAPDKDRRLLLSALAVVGSLMGGLAVAYLRSMSDPMIRGATDVPSLTRTPFLGRLPQLPFGVNGGEDASPYVLEHMRMIRTALLERLKESAGATILITSSSARTGKTSVAMLLGHTLAQLGKRVLLVEADLHRPCLAVRLNVRKGPGLIGLLTGRASDAEAIRSTDIPRLAVLPAGERVGQFDPEMLANGLFSSCLRRWRGNYDFVLMDSPPVLPVADARILARHSDGTIMVLRSSHCRKPDVIQAYADLSAAGGTLLGTVLLDGEPKTGYMDYADYGAQSETKRLARSTA